MNILILERIKDEKMRKKDDIIEQLEVAKTMQNVPNIHNSIVEIEYVLENIDNDDCVHVDFIMKPENCIASNRMVFTVSKRWLERKINNVKSFQSNCNDEDVRMLYQLANDEHMVVGKFPLF